MNITKYNLTLVKESASRYSDEIGKNVGGPNKLFRSFENLFQMSTLPYEKVVMIAFDTKMNIIGAFEISVGSLNASIVSPAEVLKRALLCNAASIALCHNHPSGDTTPSNEDIKITKRLSEACDILGIQLRDHIIIGWDNEENFTSLKTERYF